MPVLQGQVSRDDVAALCVELLEQPAALNTTFEVCSSGPAGELQDLKVRGSIIWIVCACSAAVRPIGGKGAAGPRGVAPTVSAVLACLMNERCRLAHQLGSHLLRWPSGGQQDLQVHVAPALLAL